MDGGSALTVYAGKLEKGLHMINTKKHTIFGRISAIVLALVILIGFTPIGEAEEVRADGESITLYASKINEFMNGGAPEYAEYVVNEGGKYCLVTQSYSSSDVYLVMDADLDIHKIMIYYSPLYISGSYKLTINNSANIQGNLTIESDANILLNSDYSYFYVAGDIYCKGNIEMKDAFRIYTNKNFYLNGGTISGSSTSVLVYAEKGSIYINSGSIEATLKNDGLYSKNDVVINGGTTKLISKSGCPVYANYNFTFNGGKLQAETGSTDYMDPAVIAGKGITIADTCEIKVPSDGQISDYYGYKSITGATGLKTDGVTLEGPENPNPDEGSEGGSEGGNGGSEGGNGGNNGGGNKGGNGGSGKYSNEWVNGKWYNANGVCDYAGTLSWKSDATGWWVEDSEGWYPVSQWQKIDGKYYYFTSSGYMDYSEYRDGCWLGSDGAWVESYYGGHWASDAAGWWYADASGWYPQSQWVWIDGYCYYFESSGYMATNKYVDGCWVGADGAWQ